MTSDSLVIVPGAEGYPSSSTPFDQQIAREDYTCMPGRSEPFYAQQPHESILSCEVFIALRFLSAPTAGD